MGIYAKNGVFPQYMRNTFFQHKGIIPNENAFVFQESARQKSVEATDWSWAVLMADFNMDGLKDAVVTNGYFRDITDIDFIQFSKSFNTFKNVENANISLLNEIQKDPLFQQKIIFSYKVNQVFLIDLLS